MPNKIKLFNKKNINISEVKVVRFVVRIFCLCMHMYIEFTAA